jgi:Copper amine oxidase N-terminal domain/Bacterial Ig domain
MNKRNIIAVMLIITLFATSMVAGREMFYDMYINTYPNVKDTNLDVCVCHTNPNGENERNSYGMDFVAGGYELENIEYLDSDSDGWLNIDEINSGTHPGDPESNPGNTDKTPPIIEILKPANGEIFTGGVVTIEGTASDNYQVEKIIVEIPGYKNRTLQVINGKWTMKVVFETGAEVEIKVTAYDRSGNSTTASIKIKVVFEDHLAPTIEFIFPQEGATLESFPFVVKGRTIEKDNSTELVEYSLDSGESWKKASGTDKWQFPVNMAPEGVLEIWVKATDTAGNASRPYKLKLKIQLPDLPTPKITYPLENMLVDSETLTVSGLFNKPATGVEVRIDEGQWKRAKIDGFLWMIEMSGYSEGKHVISARAFDFYNRKSEIFTLNFVSEPRDNKPPTVTIIFPEENSEFETGYLEIKGTASDESGVSRVEIKINDQPWKPVIGRENWYLRQEFLISGLNTIAVRATDYFGNISEAVQTSFTILEPLKFTFGKPDESLLLEGKLSIILSWNRDLTNPPVLKISGSTNKFEINKSKNREWIITSELGAGITDLEVNGFFIVNTKFSVSIKYQVAVNLTIGSDIMFVNTYQIKISEPALIVDGRLYIPFRSLGEAFGADVLWNGATKTATYVIGDYSYDMTLNSLIAKINGREITMGNKPLIIRDRLMIPVRAVSEVLGAGVSYDSETRTATITLPLME